MKFNLIHLETGFNSVIFAKNLAEAEEICLKKGINIYDDYILSEENIIIGDRIKNWNILHTGVIQQLEYLKVLFYIIEV